MLTGLEWGVKVVVDVVEVVAPIVLAIDVECLNPVVDAREDALSVRGHVVAPMTPHSI